MVLYLRESIIKINRLVVKLLKFILCCLFSFLIIIVLLNVVCRYILKDSMFWVTELSCYTLVYLILLGSVLALYQGEHVGINIQAIKLPLWITKIFRRANILFNYLFIILLIILGSILSYQNMKSYTGVLPIPMGIVYLAAPVSGIFMFLLYTEHILEEKDK